MRLWSLLTVCLLFASCSKGDSDNADTNNVAICGSTVDCPDGAHCAADGRCSALSSCGDDGECAYGTSCDAGTCTSNAATETQTAPNRSQIDLLMVIDDSSRMCPIHTDLMRALGNWGMSVGGSGADLNIAVVSTDVTDLESGAGLFRKAPGEGCVPTTFDVASCEERVSGVLRSAEYALDNVESATVFANALRCAAMTGVSENTGPRSGLEAMRLALGDPGQSAEFLRPGAKLAVLFVADGNDCSDGTIGTTLGPVYEQAIADGNTHACEYQRNLEDSCSYTFLSPGADRIGEGDAVKYPWEWCVAGDRSVVEGFGAQIDVTCPAGGCSNALTPRSEYYDFLLKLVADKNGYGTDLAAAADDIGVAAIVNGDSGARSDAPDPPPETCFGGATSYRYDLFARMFRQGAVANACQNWTGIFGEADPLLNQPVTTICLEQYPMACEFGDEAACVGTGGCQTQFEFQPEEYNTCSNAILRVSVDAGAGPIALMEGPDYRVDYQSRRCLESTGAPIEIRLIADYETDVDVTVEYVAAP